MIDFNNDQSKILKSNIFEDREKPSFNKPITHIPINVNKSITAYDSDR